MTQTIRAAATATVRISEHVVAATTNLREFRKVGHNAMGILAAPGHQRRDIASAIAQLQQALNLFDSTEWPSDEDHAL